MIKPPPEPGPICGTARAHMDRLGAGQGDPLLGELTLALEELGALERSQALPRARAESCTRVARAYATLERAEESDEFSTRAVALFSEGPRDDDYAEGLYDRAKKLARAGRTTEAEPLLRSAAEVVEAGGRKHRLAHWILENHGLALLELKHFAEAEGRFRAVLAMNAAAPVTCKNTIRAGALANLARALAGQERTVEADGTFTVALAEMEQQMGAEDTRTAELLALWGTTLRQHGRAAEAGPLEARAAGIYDAWLAWARKSNPQFPRVPDWEALVRALRARG